MSTPSHIYCALARPHAPALHTTFRSCPSPVHVALQHPLLLLRPPNSSSGASSRDCTSQPTTGLPPLLMSHLSMGHRSKHIHQVCSNIYFQQLHHREAHRSLCQINSWLVFVSGACGAVLNSCRWFILRLLHPAGFRTLPPPIQIILNPVCYVWYESSLVG